MKTAPLCADCGDEMVLRKGRSFGGSKPKPFWGCRNYPNCQGSHGAHPNGSPLGIPADAETKRLRVIAHEWLESAMKTWDYSIDEGYKLIETILGVRGKDAHISMLNKEQLNKLISKLKMI